MLQIAVQNRELFLPGDSKGHQSVSTPNWNISIAYNKIVATSTSKDVREFYFALSDKCIYSDADKIFAASNSTAALFTACGVTDLRLGKPPVIYHVNDKHSGKDLAAYTIVTDGVPASSKNAKVRIQKATYTLVLQEHLVKGEYSRTCTLYTSQSLIKPSLRDVSAALQDYLKIEDASRESQVIRMSRRTFDSPSHILD